MQTIQSAADVRRVFPESFIDHTELHVDTDPAIHAYADLTDMRISGSLSSLQLQALVYWRTHLEEFNPSNEAVPAKMTKEIQSANDVVQAFHSPNLLTRQEIAGDYAFIEASSHGVNIRGHLSKLQLKAVQYWLNHRDEFPPTGDKAPSGT
jgi:hypothetical protein